jgi:hypothetical protein
LFLLLYKEKTSRPVQAHSNLKPLNKFIRYQHFKMENLESVRFLVRKGDWLAKVDLKDAYFTVAVKESHHKYLRFRWKNRVFEAFGLSPAPRIFTKILKVVMAFLRRRGIRLVIHLDDILILNESKEGLLADNDIVIGLLQSLGFLINWEKSIIVPTQTIEYLGLIVDSTDPSFSLPDCKAAAVKKMCALALSEDRVKLRTLASIQGNFSWAIPAIPFAQSHYRSLQRFYISNAQRVGSNLESKVRLSPNARLDLSWWVENIKMAKCSFRANQILKFFPMLRLQDGGRFAMGLLRGVLGPCKIRTNTLMS